MSLLSHRILIKVLWGTEGYNILQKIITLTVSTVQDKQIINDCRRCVDCNSRDLTYKVVRVDLCSAEVYQVGYNRVGLPLRYDIVQFTQGKVITTRLHNNSERISDV